VGVVDLLTNNFATLVAKSSMNFSFCRSTNIFIFITTTTTTRKQKKSSPITQKEWQPKM
jgi:hypothetical protein